MTKVSSWCFIFNLILTLGVGNLCFNVTLAAGELEAGTAKSYNPSNPSTKCKDYSHQFPENGMFVAVSNGIWAGGAACGQKFLIRCLSGQNDPCKDATILVVVVDLCPTNPCPASFLLSRKAFDVVSKSPNAKIDVEYLQN